MREFLRYLYVVAAMLMVVVGDVWGQLPFNTTMTQSHYNSSSTKIASEGDNGWDGGVRLGGTSTSIFAAPAYNFDDKYIVIALSTNGVPNRITCSTTTNSSSATGIDFYIATSPDNNTYTTKWSSESRNNTVDFQLPKDTRYVKLCYSGNFAGYFKDIKISNLTYALAPKDKNFDFEEEIIGFVSTPKTTTLEWCDIDPITCTLSGDSERFEYSISNNAQQDKYGIATISVNYKYDVVGEHSAILKVAAGTNTYEINLSGTTLDKYTATFNWVLNDSYYVGDEGPLQDIYTLFYGSTDIKSQFHSSIQFSSSDPNVVAIENGKLVAKNVGEAKITAYFPGTNEWFGFTKEINLTIKKRPTSFNLIALSSCYTGEEFALSSLFSAATNNPEVALEYISGDESILKVEDGKLKAVCAGTTTLTVRQQENYKWLGHSQTLTITVNKYNSNFNLVQTQYTRKIGEVITEAQLYSHSNTEILPKVVSDNPEVVSFNTSTRQLEAKTAGQAIITISQPEDCKWTHYNVTCTVTVQKHTPVFTWNDPVYFNQALIEDYFATSNKDTKFCITNQTDREVADLYFSTSDPSDLHTLDLTTYNKGASTKVTVSQEENWYWYAKSEEHTITPIDPNNHVPFVITENNDNEVFIKNSYYGCQWKEGGVQVGDGGGGFDRDNAKFIVIEFKGVPDKLIFDYEPRDVTFTNTTTHPDDVFWFVKESNSNGGSFDSNGKNSFWDNKAFLWSTTSKNNGNTDSIQLSPTTRAIQIGYWGNFGTAFKNITVTEREEFHAVDNSDEDVDSLNFGENQVNTSKSLSFDLKYANAGYKVNLVTNDSRFTVNPTSINTIGGCKFGKETITVTYTSNLPCKIEGETSYLTITDELGHHEIVYLLASSYKLEQTIEWRDDFEAVEKPIIRMKDGQITDAATASSSLPVTYTSSDTTVIAVRNEGTVLLPKAAGEATITATQVGDETWLSVSDSKTFIVTDKIVQYIGWGEDLTDLVIGDADMTLTAKVYLRNEETQKYIYSEERTNLLQYSVGDVDVVTVSGNVLSIKGVGPTTATVTAPGNEDYAVATLTIPVHVRTKTAGCEDVLLLNHPDEVGFFAYNTNEIVQGPFGIDKEKGVPGFLSFQHRGASWDLGIQYYGGKIKAQYVTENNSTWRDAIEVTPIEDQTTLASGISLPRDATQIRFVRPSGGTGYHYVSNIQVHPAQYLEAPAEIDFGEIHVGSIETRSFEVNYSNIKDMVAVTTSSVDVTVSPPSFGKCGDYGQQTIVVTWIPSQVDVNEQKVILQDHTSLMQSEVILKAKVVKGTQDLNWQDRPTVISNCGDIEFPKQTNAHIDIKWEVINGKDVADFNGNGELELYKQGTITVKGSNTGNANYNEFYIEYEFSIEYKPIFVGTENTDWNNPNNWSVCRVPSEEDVVTIQAPVDLTTSVKVEGVKLDAGTVHIDYKGGLTVGKDGVSVTAGSITIDNTPEGAGYLRVHPDATNQLTSQVKVNYVTTAYNSGNPRDEVWQYVGAPGEGMQMSSSDRDYTLIYHWNEQKGWLQHYDDSLEPFVGYALTQNKADRGEFELWANPIMENKEISLTQTPKGMNGDNLFVNSYLAPIDVARIDPKNDYTGIEGTFYLFNSGSWNQWQNQGGKDHIERGVSPGQYYAITPGSAALINSQEDQTTIPPMQGAYVIATNNEAKLRLNYKNHVYDVEDPMNRPMRSPKLEDDNFMRVRMQVGSKNSGADRMYVIQYAECTSGYDNGYDARNILAEGQANIYTNEQDGEMEISVSDKIDETYIGFSAGNDSEYTLRLTSVVGELYLKDLETETVMAVLDGEEYIFNATPNTKNNRRFLLLDHKPEQGGVSTDVENLSSTKAWIADNVVYVSNAPINTELVVYTMSGVLVTSFVTTTTYATIDLSNMPVGVYMLRVNDQVHKFVCK